MQPNPYIAYFHNQAGGGPDVFRGPIVQRGDGLGSLFKSLFQFFRPILAPATKSIGREALLATSGALGDIATGSSVKEAAKKRLKTAGANLIQQIANQHYQEGQGRKRKRQPVLKRRKTSRYDHLKCCGFI